jgi:hypothetical protein
MEKMEANFEEEGSEETGRRRETRMNLIPTTLTQPLSGLRTIPGSLPKVETHPRDPRVLTLGWRTKSLWDWNFEPRINANTEAG